MSLVPTWTIHRPEELNLKAEGEPSHTSNQQRKDTKPLASALATILSEINSEENERCATGSGGHWLRFSVFTLNLIISSAHLMPVFLTADALNIIIMMVGATITVMVVYEESRKVCKKYKWRKRGMRSIMTIIEWIKFRIKSDTNRQLNPG